LGGPLAALRHLSGLGAGRWRLGSARMMVASYVRAMSSELSMAEFSERWSA
jgi:hypothetical protein